MSFHAPEQWRLVEGQYATSPLDGNNGIFIIPRKNGKGDLFCIVSDGMGWDHVSTRVIKRTGKSATPMWDDMCQLKDLFWDEEDCVVQYHPPKSQYVSLHPNVLHLWRCNAGEDWVAMPPTALLGPLDSEGVTREEVRKKGYGQYAI